MRRQVTRRHELAPALHTLERLLACVRVPMRDQRRPLRERLAATGPVALVRPLARVHALVHHKVARPSERLRAPSHIAHVRTLARVRPHVLAQRARVHERHAAVLARVRTLARVHASVDDEVGACGESSVAVSADVGLLAGVSTTMTSEVGVVIEDLITVGTMKHTSCSDGGRSVARRLGLVNSEQRSDGISLIRTADRVILRRSRDKPFMILTTFVVMLAVGELREAGPLRRRLGDRRTVRQGYGGKNQAASHGNVSNKVAICSRWAKKTD